MQQTFETMNAISNCEFEDIEITRSDAPIVVARPCRRGAAPGRSDPLDRHSGRAESGIGGANVVVPKVWSDPVGFSRRPRGRSL